MSVFKNIYAQHSEQLKQAIANEKRGFKNTLLVSYLTSVISSFKWGNLPEKMPIFKMEEYLQMAPMVCMFEDNGVRKIFPCFPAGALTEYGEYTQYTIISSNGQTWIRNKEDIEICYNSSLRIPYFPIINDFAEHGATSLEAVYATLRRAIKPKIAFGDEGLMKMLDSYHNTQYEDFVTAYSGEYGAEDLELKSLFDNRESDILAMWDVNTRQRNFFYSTFGINNVEITKRERLTEAEGSGNDEIVRYTLFNDMYNNRIDFIERCKKHFGYELTLEIERDATTIYQLKRENDEKLEDIEIDITKGANTSVGNTDKTDENIEEVVDNESET